MSIQFCMRYTFHCPFLQIWACFVTLGLLNTVAFACCPISDRNHPISQYHINNDSNQPFQRVSLGFSSCPLVVVQPTESYQDFLLPESATESCLTSNSATMPM